jgi:hypothetical protein
MLRIGAKISLIIRRVLLIDLRGNLLHFGLQPSIKVQKTPRQRYVRQRGIEY